mmetsp:Transcript_19258/g.57206  ORF Transcript_19258/g.57206 Transcript_19258/m.57206 type:complete len:190 (-) Transcript_19258:92-661(-)
MSEKVVEAEDSDEETGHYSILEAFATRSASRRNAPWQCKKCKWQRRCSPLKVLAHLSGTKGCEVPPWAGRFTTEERAALSAAMKSRTSENLATKKAARRTQDHAARVMCDEEIKETEAEDHAGVRRSPPGNNCGQQCITVLGQRRLVLAGEKTTTVRGHQLLDGGKAMCTWRMNAGSRRDPRARRARHV